MKNIIEHSIEKWVNDNSQVIAQSILKNSGDTESPVELLVFSSYLNKIKNEIFNRLSTNYKIESVNVSISDDSASYGVTIFFDKELYGENYGNCSYDHYDISSIVAYFENVFNKKRIIK